MAMIQREIKRLAPQLGLSLIGLLIGLLISVLCILASLALYKNLIQVATTTKLDSNHDGDIATALLVIQMEVQSAGYGIDNAKNGVEIVTTYDATAKKRRLLWRFSSAAGVYECRGLEEIPVVTSDGNFQELKSITVSSGCTQTAVLGNLAWPSTGTVLGRWRVIDDGDPDNGLDKYLGTNNSLLSYDLTSQATCSPYGASSTASNRVQLVVSAPSSAYLQGAAGLALNKYQFCLPNIYP